MRNVASLVLEIRLLSHAEVCKTQLVNSDGRPIGIPLVSQLGGLISHERQFGAIDWHLAARRRVIRQYEQCTR